MLKPTLGKVYIGRLESTGPLPAIILWSAYGKHFRWAPEMRAQFTGDGKVSDYAPVEAQDAATWCSAGYAIVVPDPRGVRHVWSAV